jgi:hypothetical protein
MYIHIYICVYIYIHIYVRRPCSAVHERRSSAACLRTACLRASALCVRDSGGESVRTSAARAPGMQRAPQDVAQATHATGPPSVRPATCARADACCTHHRRVRVVRRKHARPAGSVRRRRRRRGGAACAARPRALQGARRGLPAQLLQVVAGNATLMLSVPAAADAVCRAGCRQHARTHARTHSHHHACTCVRACVQVRMRAWVRACARGWVGACVRADACVRFTAQDGGGTDGLF